MPSGTIENLKGVGATRAKYLKELGLQSLQDLLEYFPRDYRHELAEGAIASLVAEQIQTVRGEVVACDYVVGRGRPRFEATLDDGNAKLSLVWFNGAYLRRAIHPGMIIRVRGKVRFFRGLPQMANPKWETIDEQADRIEHETFRAVYPATMSLPTDTIGKIVR